MALPDFTGPRSLPRVGQYQTKAQRLNRLEMLADTEKRRLQMQFKKEARNAYKDLGTLHGLQDRQRQSQITQGRGRKGNIWEQAANLGSAVPALGGLPTPQFQEAVRKTREETRPPTALELAQMAITPMAPQLGQQARRIPLVGREAELAANFATSPLGIASAGIAPGLTAAGLAGQATLGTA